MDFFVFFRSRVFPHFCNVKNNHPVNTTDWLMRYRYFFSILCLLFATLLHAQGWERVYGGGGQDQINGLAVTRDGGFIMGGYYNLSRPYLVKTDVDGKLQWAKNFLSANLSQAQVNAVIVGNDGSYICTGWSVSMGLNTSRNVYLFKVDPFGNIIWEKNFGGNLQEEAYDLIELADGTLAITGFRAVSGTQDALFILRTDAQGNQLWWNNFGGAAFKKSGRGIVQASNGDLLVAGDVQTTGSSSRDVYVVRADDQSGNLIWAKNYGLTYSNGQACTESAAGIAKNGSSGFILCGRTDSPGMQAGAILKIDNDGNNPTWTEVIPKTDFSSISHAATTGFFVSGFREVSSAQGDLFIGRLSDSGQFVWTNSVGKAGPDQGLAVVGTPDGGAAAAGYSNPFFNTFESNAYLVKSDGEGLIFTSYVEGNVFFDANTNCLRDGGESALQTWIVKLESPNFTRYAVTNNQGQFRIAVDTGAYTLSLFTPNEYWQLCQSTVNVGVNAFYDTIAVDLPVQKAIGCPRNEVDIATGVLHRCDTNTYIVRYCNSGTALSENTEVRVTLDRYMAYTGSSIAFSQQQGNTYTFFIGPLNEGDCGSFEISAFLACDSTITGPSHCVNAEISPTDFCLPGPWDGAVIVADATCDNDSVKLSLRNVGIKKMAQSLNFIIAEDVVMLTAPGGGNNIFFEFAPLDPSDEFIAFSTPANGKTYRIIAEQEPGYPGDNFPTAAVEGCVTDTTTTPVSYGYYTMFPDDEAEPFRASDCQESQDNDYNPTLLKRGHPKGYRDEHYIDPQTDLDFLILFRNTGADTVKQVVVRDTLPAGLDPATVFPGTSSHPYQFNVYGQGIVEFTLSNINLLPGGGSGFVNFRVAQQPDLPCGTEILNTAAIYFDFETPTYTNQTYHTICPADSFLVVKTKEIFLAGADVKVYPNPFHSEAFFEVSGVDAQRFQLELYDVQGRVVVSKNERNARFSIQHEQLVSGLYFFRIAADGKTVATGKVLKR